MKVDDMPLQYYWKSRYALNRLSELWATFIKTDQSHPPAWMSRFSMMKPRQNGRHFLDDILKCIFLNEKVWSSMKILLKLAPKGPVINIAALIQIMAERRPENKPLSEPMKVSLLTHICVTRPQWFIADSTLKFYNLSRHEGKGT